MVKRSGFIRVTATQVKDGQKTIVKLYIYIHNYIWLKFFSLALSFTGSTRNLLFFVQNEKQWRQPVLNQ